MDCLQKSYTFELVLFPVVFSLFFPKVFIGVLTVWQVPSSYTLWTFNTIQQELYHKFCHTSEPLDSIQEKSGTFPLSHTQAPMWLSQAQGWPWESHIGFHHSLSSILTGKLLTGIAIKKDGCIVLLLLSQDCYIRCIKGVNRQWKITHAQPVSNCNLAPQRKIHQEKNDVEH